jgi:hypothetical protein
MKQLDAVLLGIVFIVWSALAVMYATIPMILMPAGFRIWGLGAVLFLALTILAALAALAARAGRGSK